MSKAQLRFPSPYDLAPKPDLDVEGDRYSLSSLRSRLESTEPSPFALVPAGNDAPLFAGWPLADGRESLSPEGCRRVRQKKSRRGRGSAAGGGGRRRRRRRRESRGGDLPGQDSVYAPQNTSWSSSINALTNPPLRSSLADMSDEEIAHSRRHHRTSRRGAHLDPVPENVRRVQPVLFLVEAAPQFAIWAYVWPTLPDVEGNAPEEDTAAVTSPDGMLKAAYDFSARKYVVTQVPRPAKKKSFQRLRGVHARLKSSVTSSDIFADFMSSSQTSPLSDSGGFSGNRRSSDVPPPLVRRTSTVARLSNRRFSFSPANDVNNSASGSGMDSSAGDALEWEDKWGLPLKMGSLKKQPSSGKRGAWRERYFVCSEGALAYFENQTAWERKSAPKGVVELNTGSYYVEVPTTGPSAELRFVLCTEAAQLSCRAASLSEREEWVEFLRWLKKPTRTAAEEAEEDDEEVEEAERAVAELAIEKMRQFAR